MICLAVQFYGFFGEVTPYLILNYHLFSLQDVTEVNKPTSPLSSPSHSSPTKKIEELSVTEVSGRPSPVSVLDTPFLEDDINPGYSRFQPGKNSCTKVKKAI